MARHKNYICRGKTEMMSSFKNFYCNLSGILILSFLFNVNAVGQTVHHTCGFEPTQADMEYLHNHIMLQPKQLLAKSNDPICIPVQAYVVRTSDGFGGPDPAGWSTAMANMNHFYQDAGVSFFWKGPPVYVNNSAYYDFVNGSGTSEEGLIGLFNPPQDALNFYFVNSINGPGTAGYAYYPGETAVSNRVVMRHDQLVQINNKTVLHELGHYFSLFHTFSGNLNPEIENVTRTGPNANCNTAGDTFCDTEADPGFNPGSFNTPNCLYFGTATDMFGDLFTPPVQNFMSYFPSTCAYEFTPEQYGRIAQGVATRLGHTSYSFSAEPMDVAPPTNLVATVSNNIVTLNWTDNADNEMGYIVEMSQESATTGFRAISNSGTEADGTTLNWTGFDEDEVFWFRVKPTNASCNAYSNTVFLGGGINLDHDNSSQAGNNDFNGGEHCAPVETFITDDDVVLLGSSADVTIKIRLISPPNGANEYLLAPELEGLTFQGNGTGNFSFSNAGGLSAAEIENFLTEIKYVHAGENITSGLRTIEFFRVSGVSESPKSYSKIHIGKAVDAGLSGPFTICPEGQTSWGTLTPPNATAGGHWHNAEDIQVQGALNAEFISGV